jgi:hypothetical protein
VVRALAYSLSFYPIGLYVLLSNGKRGQVVDIVPESPKFPYVRILGASKDGKKVIVQTSQQLPILRPLKTDEIY